MADVTQIHGGSGPVAKTLVTRRHRPDTVHCLLIPLSSQPLLLPNTAVAEVVDFEPPEPIPEAPEWLLGRVNWRERRLPVISFEAASGRQPDAPTARSRIVVLNTLNRNPRVPYVAVVAQGIPQLRLANPANLSANDEIKGRSPSVRCYVMIDEEPAIIPDLDDLERRIDRLRYT